VRVLGLYALIHRGVRQRAVQVVDGVEEACPHGIPRVKAHCSLALPMALLRMILIAMGVISFLRTLFHPLEVTAVPSRWHEANRGNCPLSEWDRGLPNNPWCMPLASQVASAYACLQLDVMYGS
jgi:hypothetical protein